MTRLLRPLLEGDLSGLMDVQERGAVLGLAEVFPQDTYPFPREVIRARWEAELRDDAVAAYVGVEDGVVIGFAARRDDELLHFGTAPETWGNGTATWLHDALVATYPAATEVLRLRVFEANARARRFYERLGWRPTGERTRTAFPSYPVLLEYHLDRTR